VPTSPLILRVNLGSPLLVELFNDDQVECGSKAGITAGRAGGFSAGRAEGLLPPPPKS